MSLPPRIPKPFLLTQLTTYEWTAVAKTLMTYGGYNIDTNIGGLNFYAEFDSDWSASSSPDGPIIRNAMRQVVAVSGWLDANGNSFTPPIWGDMNLFLV